MPRFVTHRTMTPDDHQRVGQLLDAAASADGEYALSDHLRIDLIASRPDGFAAVEAIDGATLGYAQASRGNDDAWELGLVVDPDERSRTVELGEGLLAGVLAAVGDQGGGRVHWWVREPTGAEQILAERTGFRLDRELHQMRRPLPTGLPVEVDTRPFVVGRDEEAWVAVNNRAFAGHPEQGGWDVETLQAREREPWFDADGFRLYEQDGRVLGFCWTKIHPDEDTPLGEIYVIGVDPDAHGKRLGRGLTLAGLEWLSDHGLSVGMLYVDAANTKAVGLYHSLGLTTHLVKHAYVVDV